MLDDLSPADFEETAKVVVAECAACNDTRARGRLLGDAGLLAVTAPEEAGGLDLPLNFTVPVCAASGGGILGFPIIESLLLTKAFAGVAPELASKIGTGQMLATIAWQGVAEDGVVGGAPMAEEADLVLVLRGDGSGVLANIGNSVKPEKTAAFDVDAPDAIIRISGPLNGPTIDAKTVEEIQHEAAILRTAFIQGSAAQCLSTAADYAQERTQFGKPLSANQVLRHRLSRDALTIETIKNGLSRALATTGKEAKEARDALWLFAAQTGPEVAESAIQVFGGMGFTWDVPLHRHLRQMRAQAAYGAAPDREDIFATALLDATDNDWYGDIPNDY